MSNPKELAYPTFIKSLKTVVLIDNPDVICYYDKESKRFTIVNRAYLPDVGVGDHLSSSASTVS